MAVSLALVSILVVALGSALLLTAKAVPSAPNAPNSASEAARAASPLADELAYALSMPVRQPAALEFTVPDRSGDGAPETIRYAWSGVAGAPLTRQYNGGTAATVLEKVVNLQFTYDLQPVTRSEVQTVTSSTAEGQLAYFDGWSGLFTLSRYQSISSQSWIGEYVTLNLPADTTRLVITKVRLRFKPTAALGQYSVAIHPAMGGSDPVPGPAPIGTPATGDVPAPLSFDSWRDFVFADVSIPNPSGKLFIVAKATAGTATYTITYYYHSSAPANGECMRWTTDGGATWQPGSADLKKYDVRYILYGWYQTSRDQAQGVTRHFVRRVGLSLQPTDNVQSRLQTSVAVSNDVEVPAP